MKAIRTAIVIAVAGTAVALTPGSAHAANAKLPEAATLQFVSELLHARQLSHGQGVTVAILSTGVDPHAGGLSGRVTTGANYAGRIPSGSPVGIGTLLATLIASNGGSNTVEGVAPMARILSVRTDPDLREHGAGAFFDSADFTKLNAEGIRYAASHGAQVIFVTINAGLDPGLGGGLVSAVNYATSRGAVVIGADDAGSRVTDYSYPPGLPGVIGVAAVTLKGQANPFDHSRSQRNNSILIAAPGNSIGVTSKWAIDGPGAAAAWVTGAVALIKSLYPHLSPAMVARALAMSARYRPHGGYNTTIGFGLVNPQGALLAASKLAKVTATAQPGSGVVDASGYFGAGPVTGSVDAVHHSVILLALYGAALVAGLVMLISVFGLARRRRRDGGRRDLAIR